MVMERLDAAGKHPENQDPTKQFAIAQAKRFLRAAGVKDPGPKVDGVSVAAGPSVQSELDPLTSVIEAYKNQPRTPELVTQTHQAIWQVRGELVGAAYEVTPCPYTQEQLADLEANGKRVGYLPTELSTQQTRHKLGEMFPKMQSPSVKEDNSVTNDESPPGWFGYEAAIEAPYLDTKEGQLKDAIKKDGRTILSLNQYIVAGQDSKLFTGQYLDETTTWVRLGSRYDGRIVAAGFDGDGDLRVGAGLGPDDHGPVIGGPSSRANKT